MTKVNTNNGNETKVDISSWDISNVASFFIGRKILKYFKDLFEYLNIIAKSCKSDNIFPNLPSSSSTVFEWLLKFIS